MMRLEDIKSIYFIGIGGIGMSAIARYFLSLKKRVGGYDLNETELTKTLVREGADIHYTEDVDKISSDFKDKSSTLVVITPAIPKENKELVYFTTNGFEVIKRAEVLGIITRASKSLCIAGTHGKTTTSTMLAHLMNNSKVGCTAFLGGISKNYHTNLILSASSPYTVIEADEFDRSFHHLTPYMTAITSVDADHLDIYGSEEKYIESFNKYTSLINEDGVLLIRKGINISPKTKNGVKTFTYSKDEGDFHADSIRIGNGEITIDFVMPDGRINEINLGVPVSINIENGVAAMALAHLNGVTDEEIKEGMSLFRGVDRRFDFKIKNNKHVLLTDYAHHPEEIKQSVKSMKELYQGRKVMGVFQPHLYSRTKDFYKEFADSLSLLDEVILVEIYPARELPIEGVSSKLIYDNIKEGTEKTLCKKDELMDILSQKDIDVLMILGAGDIEKYAEKIAKTLEA